MGGGWISRARHLIERLRRGERIERDLDEEVQGYFEAQVERAMARGLSREEARRAVRLVQGDAELVKEQVRSVRTGAALDSTIQDLRYGWRLLRRSPGFTVFAGLTIALCLGANAAMFSLVDGVLLKSSGYAEPERIVLLSERLPGGGRNRIAPANYLDWASQSRSFESMAAQSSTTMNLTGATNRALHVGRVSAPYFEVFGARAALGRTFARDEDRPGRDRVTVLSHSFWLNQLGAEPGLIGRKIHLNGEGYTVIGVMPRNSAFDRRGADLWVPLTLPTPAPRGFHYLTATARLKRGVTVAQAQAEMGAIAGRIAELHPDIKNGWSATVDRFLDQAVGPGLRWSLLVLMSAVGAVLLIGCANLANLLMARGTLRSHEIALRVALGASRGRVIRMLLTESLLLSLGGALVGVAVGYGLLKGLQSLLPPFFFPAEANIAMDGRVLLFLAAITVLTGLAFGLAPAMQASRAQPIASLKEGRAIAGSRRKHRLRHLFVAGQVAGALVLLVAGGLLIRSLQRVMNVDTGFETEGLVAANLPLTMEDRPDPTELRQYVQQVLESVRAEPGIQDAAVTTALPLRGWDQSMAVRRAMGSPEAGVTGFKIVTPRYFPTLGLRLVAGRLLGAGDVEGSPPVIVVNESFVRRYFAGEAALGKRVVIERILPTGRGLGPQVAWEIVGIVADEKGRGLENPTDVGAYASFQQNPMVGLGLVARGSGEGNALVAALQRAVLRVNRHQSLDRPQTVEEIKKRSLTPRRLVTALLGGFAALALLIAGAGIYGLLSFVAASRTQELGIRAALGASRGDLIRVVLGGAAGPVLAGIAIGLAGALAFGQLIQRLLFATSPTDPASLLGVSALFLVVALAACLVPAWRAARATPMSTLRQE